MTLKELAKRANVSVSTASKALNYSKELHVDTIELVNRVARESGFFDEQRRQKLFSTKNKPIKFAIICPEIISVFYTGIATKINEILWERGAVAQIHVCNFDNKTERGILLSCLEEADIGGVITLFGGKAKNDFSLPIVGTNNNMCPDWVDIDYKSGIEQAVGYLKERGIDSIGFIGEKLTTSKEEAFLHIAEKAGITVLPEHVVCSLYRFEKAGYEAMRDFIENNRPLPDAFVTAYDEIAMGAISYLMSRGRKVPDDVAFIGINDIPSAKYFPVPLTTLGFDTDALCRAVVQTIFERIYNPTAESICTTVKTELIIRNSA